MLQQITGCTGDCCPKAKDCERYYENLAKKLNTSFPLESWAIFSSGSMWINSETGKSGCSTDYYCGPNGNYKMFKPYMKPLSELTLGEIKEICSSHLKNNKSKYCDGCKLYDFCNEQISNTRYLLDWELNGE